MLRQRPPFYPFVIALYPVIALAAQNTHERVRFNELLVPVGVSLYVALVAWAMARPLTRDTHRRALLTAVAVLLFCTYGATLHLIQSRTTFVEEWLSLWVLVGQLLLIGSIVWLIGRVGRGFSALTGYLNTFSVVLILLPFVSMAVPARSVMIPVLTEETVSAPTEQSPRPDVYVVILDSYNSSKNLLREYAFDNSDFEGELKARGFVVPSSARSNYAHTFLALASMLNGRYLDSEIAQVRPSSGNRSLLDPLIENHLLWRTLDARGYRFVFFPTFYAQTADNHNADVKLPSPSETSSEFGLVWLRMTPVIPLARSTCRLLRCSLSLFDLTPEPARLIDWKFAQLGSLPTAGVPTLAFMHLLPPHEPFVYDAECRARDVYWPRAFPARDEPKVKAAYVAQLKCVNKKTLAAVDALLSRTNRSAVIVLQADHGYGRLGRGPDSYGRASPEQMEERTSIFSAYYLPGRPAGLIYDSITPVNAFRAILNHYFGGQTGRVEDRVYFSTHDTPYDLVRLK
jgi:hypothetical protein